MSGFAKDGVLYPTGIYAIDDNAVSPNTGWSSKKVMDKLASVKSIMRVDAKPTYADGTITYVKDGTSYTTTDQEAWFYYVADDELYKTIFIDGVEYTKPDSSVSFDDFIEKTSIATVLDDTVTNKQVVGALTLKEELDKVFQDVDNGKDLIASAITDKGVDTSKDDTFETMANNISSIIQSGNMNVIHNAMESLGYDYTDLSGLNIDDTARLISKCFILKQASENVSNIMSATAGVNFNNFLIDGKLQDFGNVINPVYTKETINQTKNTVNNVFVSDDISVELINVYMGSV